MPDVTLIRFHTPTAADAVFPYHVLSAGRTRALPGEAPVVRRYNQHVLILTLAGRGQLRTGGRLHGAEPGTIAWLNTAEDYAHGCDPRAEHWHYAWIGFAGFGLDQMFDSAVHGTQEPVARIADPEAYGSLFKAILDRMECRPPGHGALDSADVAVLIARIMEDRRREFATLARTDLSAVQRVVLALRPALASPWCIEEIADIAGLSASQLHRLFRKELGLTPMRWLKIERINAAKTALAGSPEAIASVAAAVGYDDPYHFSRDFRKVTGRSPRAFRASGGA